MAKLKRLCLFDTLQPSIGRNFVNKVTSEAILQTSGSHYSQIWRNCGCFIAAVSVPPLRFCSHVIPIFHDSFLATCPISHFLPLPCLLGKGGERREISDAHCQLLTRKFNGGDAKQEVKVTGHPTDFLPMVILFSLFRQGSIFEKILPKGVTDCLVLLI